MAAATAYTTPAAIEFSTAALTVDDADPAMLTLATAGSSRFLVTQSMPEISALYAALPEQSMTRTEYTFAPFATP